MYGGKSMGRNKKYGLDYFPFDIDLFQDIRIRKLIKYQSGKAIAVYALLLCIIYKDGYYVRWDKELPFIISEQTGFEEAYVLEVINSCLKLGLFNEELYTSDGILTSKGIQERYKKICDLCRRNSEISEFTLISSEEKPISSEEMPINSAKSTQSKEKKRKENITVDSNESPVCATCQPHDERIDYSELVKFFNEKTQGVFGVIRMPLSDKRKGMINARIKTYGKETFAQMIQKALNSDFLKGQNKNGWRASFDWLIKPTNFEKVISGNYDNKSGNDRTNDRSSGRDFGKFFQGIAEGIARADYEERNG